MTPIPYKSPEEIRLLVSFYANCDDVQLCWRALDATGKDSPITGCLGFMIERERKFAGKWSETEILRNRVGFGDTPIDPDNFEQITQPSNIWPFQRYDWTEHGANNNDAVRYRISAVGYTNDNWLPEDPLEILVNSDWTPEILVTPKVDDDFEVYFNRGTLMSQYVARIARKNKWTKLQIKENIKEIKEPLRLFLSGELRLALIRILDDVAANPFLTLHAALFELGDTELVDKLKKIGARVQLILSDGANTKNKKGEPVQYVDENEKVRKELNKAGVIVYDRILAKEGLGHNKIVIVVDKRTNKPVLALSGSTNWTSSGLCTQLNNAIIVRNEEFAKIFFEYWLKLRDAGNSFTTTLMDFNGSKPHTVGNMEAWFTRTVKTPKGKTPPDIQYIQDLISNAKESIQYIMFQPGSEPLSIILQRRADKDIYIRGVVSTVIESNKEKFEIIDEAMGKNYKEDLIQPSGFSQYLTYWVKELDRHDFIPSVGYAITHTKMIVIDAMTEHPVVITGSHNFSAGASQKNDENFVVIKGNKKLAEHYAVACASIYAHYRYRAYVKDCAASGREPWNHLTTTPNWQISRLNSTRNLKHMSFWCGKSRDTE